MNIREHVTCSSIRMFPASGKTSTNDQKPVKMNKSIFHKAHVLQLLWTLCLVSLCVFVCVESGGGRVNGSSVTSLLHGIVTESILFQSNTFRSVTPSHPVGCSITVNTFNTHQPFQGTLIKILPPQFGRQHIFFLNCSLNVS